VFPSWWETGRSLSRAYHHLQLFMYLSTDRRILSVSSRTHEIRVVATKMPTRGSGFWRTIHPRRLFGSLCVRLVRRCNRKAMGTCRGYHLNKSGYLRPILKLAFTMIVYWIVMEKDANATTPLHSTCFSFL
jgi:hypothetical protein